MEDGKITSSSGKKVLEEMIKEDKSPSIIVKERMEQINDIDTLLPIIQEAIASSEKAVKEYKSGKKRRYNQ